MPTPNCGVSEPVRGSAPKDAEAPEFSRIRGLEGRVCVFVTRGRWDFRPGGKELAQALDGHGFGGTYTLDADGTLHNFIVLVVLERALDLAQVAVPDAPGPAADPELVADLRGLVSAL